MLAELKNMGKVLFCACLCLFILLLSAPVTPAKELVIALKSLEVEPYEVALKSFKETLKRKGYDLNVEELVLKEDTKQKENILSKIRRKNSLLIVTLDLLQRPLSPSVLQIPRWSFAWSLTLWRVVLSDQ